VSSTVFGEPVSWDRRTVLAISALAAVVFVATVATLPQYGITSDEPVLWYGGELEWWALRSHDPNRWKFKEAPPKEFAALTHFDLHPDNEGHWRSPAFATTFSVAFSRLVRFLPGFEILDQFRVGLVVIHALGIFGIGLYVARLLGRRRALLASALFALYPSAAGHSHYNIKDWPSAVFYTLCVLAFATGTLENRALFLLQSGIWLGLGLACCRPTLVFIAPTLLLWLPFALPFLFRGIGARIVGWAASCRWLPFSLPHLRGGPLPSRRTIGAALLVPWLAAVVFWGAWPYLHTGTLVEQWNKFSDTVSFFADRGQSVRASFSAYPFVIAGAMTPPIYLVGLLAAAVLPFLAGRREVAVASLGWIWLAIPLLRIALPHSNYYDANRHFLEYIGALAVLSATGIDLLVGRVASWVRARWTTVWTKYAVAIGLLFATGCAAYPVVHYHPYESAYYNFLVGGLGGAQKKKLSERYCKDMEGCCPDTEGDYWGFSYRLALKEIGRRAEPKATFTACGDLVEPLTKYQTPRAGLTSAGLEQADWFVVIPRSPFCNAEKAGKIYERADLVTEVRRDGGLIWALYRHRVPLPPPQTAAVSRIPSIPQVHSPVLRTGALPTGARVDTPAERRR
jgi:hypothetical protein